MSRVRGIDLTQDVAEILIEENEQTHFASKLRFLQQHKGIRKGKLHTILGIEGGGKSTLTRTILLDVTASLKKGKKVAIYLSEETSTDFITALAYSGVFENAQVLVDRMEIYSEQDEHNHLNTEAQHFEELKYFYFDESFDVVLIDNMTTATIYADKHPERQKEIMKRIKNVAQNKEKATILIAHTSKEIKENSNVLITSSHVRGSNQLAMMSEYFYVLQTFNVGSEKFTTLRITKSRAHNSKDRFFKLCYNQRMKLYDDAVILDWQKFKEIYKNRNTL